ncbi:hypothetical protein [Microlunatus speluncae]|uniref:hypothetical protein n=1 Tax=Microlunatus speluncae TaxID=2594267 RepID=UPI0012666934|nr:hypothetical protein [Microlunatus speluncae]
MSKRFWVGVVVAAAISVLGVAVVAFVTNAQAPISSPDRHGDEGGPPPTETTESDEETIMGVARDFLRYGAKGKPVEACLMVIDNGGILNPCEDDLGPRKDWKALAELDPDLTVTGINRDGNRAVITNEKISPATTLTVSIEIIHTEYGSWKVRKLNGKTIAHEEAGGYRR